MNDELIRHAASARERAIAPYSQFKVGAALQTPDGRIYTGCNIESLSLGLTLCAERVALLKALSEGDRHFQQIAIVTDSALPTPPCGACRQLLWEYCGDIPVHMHSTAGAYHRFQLSELFPYPFDVHNLQPE